MAKKQSAKTPTDTPTRPPIVVVLGHVDHGKTTLLDSIRKTDVASKEHGGITQSIGAYQITLPATSNKQLATITFIDTPGHEAFTNMRSRGAQVADIAILVVAANDSVMPQTVESIKIIKQAGIPYIVAINKIDLPEANFDKVVQDLLRHEVMLENYGGDTPYVKLSAKTGQGVKELLDLIELLSQVKEIGKIQTEELSAVIIESRLDKNRGALATAIVKSGTLKVGEEVYINEKKSKIRALIDYTNSQIKEAGPGTPVEILGLTEVPPVGSEVSKTVHPAIVVEQNRPLGSLLNRSDQEGTQSLSLILKADTLGSLEAITAQIPTNVNVIATGVGEITEADVMLAKSTKAIILGFNNKITSAAQKLTETEKVLARSYKIIYELLDELKDAAAGMLTPIETEEVLGVGQVIAEFPFEKMRICGTKITDGRMARGDQIKILRGQDEQGNDVLVGKGRIKSVRSGKDEVNKVEKGKDCGILLDPQVDFRVGDAIISYRIS